MITTPIFNIFNRKSPNNNTGYNNLASNTLYAPEARSLSESYRYNNLTLNTLQADTVSFGRKKSIPVKKQILNLPYDAFPSNGAREYILSQIENPDKTILDIHKEYYSKLLECKTLDDAKKIYPEFKDVTDTKDIDVSKTGSSSIYRKIAKGKINGLTMENFSFELLKKFYGELISYQEDEKYFNFPQSTTNKLLNDLNIKMDKRYSKVLAAQRLSEAHIEIWKDETYRQMQTDIALNMWQDDTFRQKQTESRIKKWQNPEYKKAISQARKKSWQEDEYRSIMKVVANARSEAWNRHPEFKNAYAEVAKEFPLLKSIIAKVHKGQKLSKYETSYEHAYFKKCLELHPEIPVVIAETQKEIMQEWGFYDKKSDEYIALIANTANEQ